MPDVNEPGRSFPPGELPPDLRESLQLFRNLTTDEEVLHAFSRAGLVMVGRPPAWNPADLSPEDREGFKSSWGLTTEDEVSEALRMAGLVTVGVSDLSAAARTARHPLIVAKAIMVAIQGLEAQLRDVVPILRERGSSWTQIGAALGMTKQSAWERFSGED
jgi:hypothetical protein